MSCYSEQELITLLINSRDFLDLISIYHQNMIQLKEYTILVFDDQRAISVNKKPPLDITNKFRGVSIVSIFKSSFCILNEAICQKMSRKERADFEYKYCIDLDVNMMNTLVDFHNHAGETVEPNSVVSELDLINRDVTCYPYIIENANKLENADLEKHVIDTLLIFNKFKHSNLHTFTSEYLSTKTDYRDTKGTIDIMKKLAGGEAELLTKAQKYIYALLLKSIIISFVSKRSIKLKMLELMEFVNHNLGLFMEREIVICYWFLKNRNDERINKFFKCVQPNAKSLVEKIQGMSWDLFHLRFCCEIMTSKDIDNNLICLHYLATHDNGLADLANAHSIKYIIHKRGDITPKTVYAEPICDIISEIDVLQDLQNNAVKRGETYKTKNIDDLICELEKSLLNI